MAPARPAHRTVVLLALLVALLALPPAANAAVPSYVRDWYVTAVGWDYVAVQPGAGGKPFGVLGDNTGSNAYRFDSPTTITSLHHAAGSGALAGLAVDSGGVVYVAHRLGPQVAKIVPTDPPTVDADWGKPAAPNAFVSPYDVAISPINGKVYVMENHKITRLNTDGSFDMSWSSAGPATLNNASGIAIDADGNVFVASQGSNQVQVFDANGGFIRQWTTTGPQFGEGPRDVAVAPDNTVYVAHMTRIKMFTREGTPIDEFFQDGTGPGAGRTASIAVGSDGDLYVADYNNHRVQQFSFNPPGPGPGPGPVTPTQGTIAGVVTGPSGPAAGAAVQACLTDGRGCLLGTTDGAGRYRFLGAVNGTWEVRANPPAGLPLLIGPSAGHQVAVAGGDVTVDLPLLLLRGPPEGTSFEDEAGTKDVDGVPVVNWNEPVTLKTYWCSKGTVHAEIRVNGATVRRLALFPNPKKTNAVGNIEFSATTPPLVPLHGPIEIVMTRICGKDNDVSGSFNAYIDPSGNVYTLKGAPVVGATVTLMREETGVFATVPNGSILMSPSNRVNPDKTGLNGAFGWDVLAGRYKLRVEKKGCFKPKNKKVKFIETPVYDIPPPVVGLKLKMDCPDKKKPKVSKLKIKRRVLSFKVSEAAKVTALMERCKKGRKKCKRAKSFRRKARFSQMVEFAVPKKVKKGRYRVTVSAVDFAKNRGRPVKRTLAVK